MENVAHKQMFEIWTAEKPLTGKCTEVDEHVQMLEKGDQTDSPFSGCFGFARNEDPGTIIAKMELKHVGDRVMGYSSGVIDPNNPNGFEILEDKKSFHMNGMTAVLQENGNFDCGMGFGMIKLL